MQDEYKASLPAIPQAKPEIDAAQSASKTFDVERFGRISADARSTNEKFCVIQKASENRLGAIIRRSDLLTGLELTGIKNPSTNELEMAARSAAFVCVGISRQQAKSRLEEDAISQSGHIVVLWVKTVRELFANGKGMTRNGVADTTWDVPCAFIVFQLKW
jgi:hypothetical protein